MTRRLVILINARQASVLDWRRGSMHWLGDFATTQAGLTEFQRLLMQHSMQPVRIAQPAVPLPNQGFSPDETRKSANPGNATIKAITTSAARANGDAPR